MIVGTLILGFLIWLLIQRSNLWRPQGQFRAQSPTPLPRPLPAQADGCWHETTATLWFSHAGPLKHQGLGTLRCLGDQFVWLSTTGTITVPWESIVGVHGHPNGVLIHAAGLTPLVLSVPDNEQLHAWLTQWLAHAWWWDAGVWVSE